MNVIQNIQQTMATGNKSEPFTYADFLSQFRGRVIKDKNYCELIECSETELEDLFS
jgi:hypothetical protein